MKKIMFLFFVSFIFILPTKADSTFYLGEKVPNMYIESISGSDMHNGAPFLIHRSDGAFVYCINPFKMMSTTGIYKAYTYNDSIFNLTNEQLNKLNIISYYGYGYQNHTDIKWFGITQYMMWKSLGFTDVYFTDVYYGSRVEKYQSEVNELESLINSYYKLPSFSNNTYEYDPNNTYELIDTNNVLSNYEILESNISASINNNKLIINTQGNGNFDIAFVRKSPINGDYILYNLDDAQALIYPGKIDDITFNISIKVNSGSITINKYDSENKNRLEASLAGSIFGIYKDNALIGKLTINNNGSANINNLAFGNYEIKELVSSKGYNKDTNIYKVTIDNGNKDVVINSYSDVIKGNLIINKYYGSNEEYKLDDNALFEIYNNNKLIKTINNNTILELEYGIYLIKQTSGKKYYDLIDDFSISVLEERDYKYDFYTDKTDEIKAYEELLNKKESSLNQKEKDLIELQNKIEQDKNNLINLKNEIVKKQDELDTKREELKLKEENLLNLENKIKTEKENLNNLKEELFNDSILLDIKKEEILKQEDELNKLKNELDLMEKQLSEKSEELKKLESNINKKEIALSKAQKELELLGFRLEEKEKKLIELENNIVNKEEELKKEKEQIILLSNSLKEKEYYIINKEMELNKKEQELTKLENKKNVLVVEVPNTNKKSYNKLMSKILILIGCLFIIFSKKKTTDYC